MVEIDRARTGLDVGIAAALTPLGTQAYSLKQLLQAQDLP
jgi:hypothetical protein